MLRSSWPSVIVSSSDRSVSCDILIGASFHILRVLSSEAAFILYCHECGSSDLRTAHLRLRDYGYLLVMKWPIRCRTCKARSYAPIRMARALPRPLHPRMRDRKGL